MLTFNAIDVETANADSGNICQIGITHVVDGEIAEVWSTLVNPEDSFDRMNVRLHGIAAKTVVDSPTIPALSGQLRRRLDGDFSGQPHRFRPRGDGPCDGQVWAPLP